MKTSLHWRSDEFGTLILHPFGTEGGYLWVQARRQHCDRGHWEWSWMGLPGQDVAEPSFYFMRLNTALQEAELWLLRRMGEPDPKIVSIASLVPDAIVAFKTEAAVGRRWQWKRTGNELHLMTEVPDQDGERVIVEINERDVRGGKAFIMQVSGVNSLDAADRVPRTYLRLDHALQETEDFLAWRTLKVPAEHPSPFVDVVQPVGDATRTYLAPDAELPVQRPRWA